MLMAPPPGYKGAPQAAPLQGIPKQPGLNPFGNPYSSSYSVPSSYVTTSSIPAQNQQFAQAHSMLRALRGPKK